jgi:hypothetical protein
VGKGCIDEGIEIYTSVFRARGTTKLISLFFRLIGL